MSDPNDNSIPLLNEVLVPGRADGARAAVRTPPASAPSTQPAAAPSSAPLTQGSTAPLTQGLTEPPTQPTSEHIAPREPGFRTEPHFTPQPAPTDAADESAEPVLAPQPVLTPQQTRSPEPMLAPEPEPASESAQMLADVFDRSEPAAPLEAGATVPPDIAREASVETEAAALLQADLDADEIAERLRGRLAGFLTGDGRGLIEARCRDALHEHTSLLVSQITREVVLTLESELSGWVREAVEEEIARRGGRAGRT